MKLHLLLLTSWMVVAWTLLALLPPSLAQQPPNNQQQNLTIQLPVLGVAVDATGVLKSELKQDLSGQLVAAKLLAARQLPGEIQRPSNCRKISLRRLAEELERLQVKGNPTSNEISHLAGLTKIDFVFIDGERQDIIIAGPAGAWAENLAGQAVSLDNGRAVLQLDDLVTALRLFPPNQVPQDKWLACSIDPTVEGLAKYNELQKRIPNRISDSQRAGLAEAILPEMQRALGMANIRVHGLDPRSQLAHVLIAADYEMKLMAIGLERPPVRLTTFLDAISGAINQMQRWWLVPDYECLLESPDRRTLAFQKSGVKLLTEDYALNAQGQLVSTGEKPSRASRAYADSFTENFDALASRHAGFAKLRQAMDWLILAAWFQSADAFQRVGWNGGLLLNNEDLPAQLLNEPKQAPCVANAIWKDRLLVMPVGGGVSIQPSLALKEGTLQISDKVVLETGSIPQSAWWWD